MLYLVVYEAICVLICVIIAKKMVKNRSCLARGMVINKSMTERGAIILNAFVIWGLQFWIKIMLVIAIELYYMNTMMG